MASAQLPPELLEQCLSHVTWRDLLTTSLVCRLWLAPSRGALWSGTIDVRGSSSSSSSSGLLLTTTSGEADEQHPVVPRLLLLERLLRDQPRCTIPRRVRGTLIVHEPPPSQQPDSRPGALARVLEYFVSIRRLVLVGRLPPPPPACGAPSLLGSGSRRVVIEELRLEGVIAASVRDVEGILLGNPEIRTLGLGNVSCAGGGGKKGKKKKKMGGSSSSAVGGGGGDGVAGGTGDPATTSVEILCPILTRLEIYADPLAGTTKQGGTSPVWSHLVPRITSELTISSSAADPATSHPTSLPPTQASNSTHKPNHPPPPRPPHIQHIHLSPLGSHARPEHAAASSACLTAAADLVAACGGTLHSLAVGGDLYGPGGDDELMYALGRRILVNGPRGLVELRLADGEMLRRWWVLCKEFGVRGGEDGEEEAGRMGSVSFLAPTIRTLVVNMPCPDMSVLQRHVVSPSLSSPQSDSSNPQNDVDPVSLLSPEDHHLATDTEPDEDLQALRQLDREIDAHLSDSMAQPSLERIVLLMTMSEPATTQHVRGAAQGVGESGRKESRHPATLDAWERYVRMEARRRFARCWGERGVVVDVVSVERERWA